MHVWEKVVDSGSGERVMRLPVPGGWLYQMEVMEVYKQPHGPDDIAFGWTSPVFVPEVKP